MEVPRATLTTLAYLLLYHVLLIDLPSIAYAFLVVTLAFRPPPHLFWPLWVAKYQGFAVNLAATVLLACVMKNLKRTARLTAPWLRYKNILEYRWNWPRLTINRSHALYTYRVLASGVVHTLAHALFTHRFRLRYDERFTEPITVDNLLLNSRPEFRELGLAEQARVVLRSLFLDTHTWTGYALLALLFAPILFTGLRLARYARRHHSVLLLHRLVAGLTIPLLVLHHPIYFWPALWLAMVLVDWLVGVLVYTESCTVTAVHRYPNYQIEDARQLNDVVDLQFRYPARRLEQFQPGDFVRVKAPAASRVEWHDFTLMRGEPSPLFDCTAHITVRSVGRWTKRLYLLAQNRSTVLLVKGPYSANFYDPLMHRIMLSGSSRFEPAAVHGDDDGGDHDDANKARRWCCWLAGFRIRSIPMPRTLVLVCSGTAITHSLSILDTLIPLYYRGYRADELPRKIVVCWTVRTVFNLNFSLIPLSRYQRQLADCRLVDLLVYEFFVSQKPDQTDALCAQTFRRILMSMQADAARPDHDIMLRNSRLSSLDIITTQEQVNTTLGNRINYVSFGRRHLQGADETLLLVNTSVQKMRQAFEALAREHKCRIHSDSLF